MSRMDGKKTHTHTTHGVHTYIPTHTYIFTYKYGSTFGGAGGRRSLVVRSLSVILTLQSKFLNRVRSCVDM